MSRFSNRSAPATCAILATLSLAVPVRAAADNEATAAPRTSLTTLSAASRAILQRTAHKSETQTPTPNDQAFFKTPKGAVTLVLIGAGVGYALYSKVHDRVASPVR